MPYTLPCKDKPGAVKTPTHPAHLEHLGGLNGAVNNPEG